MVEEELYHAAINKWGLDSQIHMAQEELAELSVVLSHLLRERAGVEEVADEVADVEIMLAQIKVAFPSVALMSRVCKQQKLKRLEVMIHDN